mmetsp:Transcript_45389/g.141037  ORF Transcript_45389/g.141037 Transcript_45389/m.141037 type:complete len:287 (+) Transcript_45389:387-1247(+)
MARRGRAALALQKPRPDGPRLLRRAPCPRTRHGGPPRQQRRLHFRRRAPGLQHVPQRAQPRPGRACVHGRPRAPCAVARVRRVREGRDRGTRGRAPPGRGGARGAMLQGDGEHHGARQAARGGEGSAAGPRGEEERGLEGRRAQRLGDGGQRGHYGDAREARRPLRPGAAVQELRGDLLGRPGARRHRALPGGVPGGRRPLAAQGREGRRRRRRRRPGDPRRAQRRQEPDNVRLRPRGHLPARLPGRAAVGHAQFRCPSYARRGLRQAGAAVQLVGHLAQGEMHGS